MAKVSAGELAEIEVLLKRIGEIARGDDPKLYPDPDTRLDRIRELATVAYVRVGKLRQGLEEKALTDLAEVAVEFVQTIGRTLVEFAVVERKE
jgi:hypothetical protein